jgi:hypothetical protein
MPGPQEVEVQAARRQQSKASKRATFEQLTSKKRREKELSIILPGGSDEVTLLFRAIGAVEYDKLMAACPPTVEQKAQGEPYDANRFAPSLISHTLIEPELTVQQAEEIWGSPEWSRGEVMTLFLNALEVCSSGFDVPPIAND